MHTPAPRNNPRANTIATTGRSVNPVLAAIKFPPLLEQLESLTMSMSAAKLRFFTGITPTCSRALANDTYRAIIQHMRAQIPDGVACAKRRAITITSAELKELIAAGTLVFSTTNHAASLLSNMAVAGLLYISGTKYLDKGNTANIYKLTEHAEVFADRWGNWRLRYPLIGAGTKRKSRAKVKAVKAVKAVKVDNTKDKN